MSNKLKKLEEGKIIKGGNTGKPTTAPIEPTPQNLRPAPPASNKK